MNGVYQKDSASSMPPTAADLSHNHIIGLQQMEYTHPATAGGSSDSVSVFIITLVVNNLVGLSRAPENCVSYMLNLRS